MKDQKKNSNPPAGSRPTGLGGDAKGHALPLESGALFGDAQELIIRHGGEPYRLRRTKNGKLLLTK